MKAWLNVSKAVLTCPSFIKKKKVKSVSLNENQPKLKVVSEKRIKSVKKTTKNNNKKTKDG